ncbi:hypothetical protein HGH92_11095 [Chitinophaga varians]|uniref:Uncharacterized protein n=1 Tax=Chitinophaga varians TaxID=2202339 RepID=A0A847RFR7_9BACT|nr:hypothetical protein [Chitinophaga varians]NLR64850.1 hypothetical protein [Chitinophaga varians]
MKDYILDKILNEMLEQSATGKSSFGLEFLESLGREYTDMKLIRYLEHKGYIKMYTFPSAPFWEMQLTMEGRFFTSQGGFSKDRLNHEENRRYNKLIFRIALWTLIITAAAFVVAAISLFR